MTKKILIVCLGNICRSPLAEGILRKMALEKKIPLEVDSAGMESFHVGEPPDPRTQKNARQHGLDLSSLRARQFEEKDFDRFDKIYVADRHIYSEVMAFARNGEDRKKVDCIANVLFPGENRPVPDPYYGGEAGFEEVFQFLNRICSKITELVSANKL